MSFTRPNCDDNLPGRPLIMPLTSRYYTLLVYYCKPLPSHRPQHFVDWEPDINPLSRITLSWTLYHIYDSTFAFYQGCWVGAFFLYYVTSRQACDWNVRVPHTCMLLAITNDTYKSPNMPVSCSEECLGGYCFIPCFQGLCDLGMIFILIRYYGPKRFSSRSCHYEEAETWETDPALCCLYTRRTDIYSHRTHEKRQLIGIFTG